MPLTGPCSSAPIGRYDLGVPELIDRFFKLFDWTTFCLCVPVYVYRELFPGMVLLTTTHTERQKLSKAVDRPEVSQHSIAAAELKWKKTTIAGWAASGQCSTLRPAVT